MSIAQLVALERSEKAKKIRGMGFLPGIVYSRDFQENIPVKFKYSDVANIVSQHGERAKLQIIINNKKHLAFIKDIQRDHISCRMIHLDLQVASGKEDIKVKVPVVFEGIPELDFKKLILEIDRHEIEISGKTESIPEIIKVDVSGMNAGDHVTVNDLHLDAGLKVSNNIEKLATVYKLKESAEVEEATEKAEEPAEK
ncbi:MAG: 50S ribosomal protein L25 [Bacillota bacterium]|nr:50S ribosomal protein L25 [Bacillota bacterium]